MCEENLNSLIKMFMPICIKNKKVNYTEINKAV